MLVFGSRWLFDQEKSKGSVALGLKGQLETDISIPVVERNTSVCRLAIMCLRGCAQFLAVMGKSSLLSGEKIQ